MCPPSRCTDSDSSDGTRSCTERARTHFEQALWHQQPSSCSASRQGKRCAATAVLLCMCFFLLPHFSQSLRCLLLNAPSSLCVRVCMRLLLLLLQVFLGCTATRPTHATTDPPNFEADTVLRALEITRMLSLSSMRNGGEQLIARETMSLRAANSRCVHQHLAQACQMFSSASSQTSQTSTT